jgi:hypothetical protein
VFSMVIGCELRSEFYSLDRVELKALGLVK